MLDGRCVHRDAANQPVKQSEVSFKCWGLAFMREIRNSGAAGCTDLRQLVELEPLPLVVGHVGQVPAKLVVGDVLASDRLAFVHGLRNGLRQQLEVRLGILVVSQNEEVLPLGGGDDGSHPLEGLQKTVGNLLVNP